MAILVLGFPLDCLNEQLCVTPTVPAWLPNATKAGDAQGVSQEAGLLLHTLSRHLPRASRERHESGAPSSSTSGSRTPGARLHK